MDGGQNLEGLTYGQLGEIMIKANESGDTEVVDWARGLIGAQTVGPTQFKRQAAEFLERFDAEREHHQEATGEPPPHEEAAESLGPWAGMMMKPPRKTRVVKEKNFGMVTPGDAFYMEPDFYGQPVWDGLEEGIYNAEVLTGPIEEDNGKRYVRTSSGLVAIPNRDEYAEAAYDALRGVKPGSGNLVHDGVMLFDNPLFGITDDIETPAGKLPFAVGIAEDVETERLLLQKPAEMRALMEAASKHDQSWFETATDVAAGAALPLAEFWGVAKVAGLAGKAVGAGARALSTSENLGVLSRVGNTLGAIGKSMQASRATTHTPRKIGFAFDARQALLEEPLYAVTRNLVTGNASALEGMIEGVQEGTAESAITSGARFGLRTAGKLGRGMARIGIGRGMDSKVLRRLAGEAKREGAQKAIERMIDAQEIDRGFVREHLRAVTGDAVMREHLLSMYDVASVSIAFGSYQASVREAMENGEDWSSMGLGEKAMRMASNIGAPEVAGQAAAFGLAMSSQIGLQKIGLTDRALTAEMEEKLDGWVQQVMNANASSEPGKLSGWAATFDGMTADEQMEDIASRIDDIDPPPPVKPGAAGDGPVQPENPGGRRNIEAAAFRHGSGMFGEPGRMADLAKNLPAYGEAARTSALDAAALSAQHTGLSLRVAAAATGQTTQGLQERRTALLKNAFEQHGDRVRSVLDQVFGVPEPGLPERPHSARRTHGLERLYHETSPQEAITMLQTTGGLEGLFVSPLEEMALGQGGQGAVIELDPGQVRVRPHQKPGSEFVQASEGSHPEWTVEEGSASRAIDAIRSITFQEGKVSPRDMARMRSRGWDVEDVGGGRIRFSKPQSRSGNPFTDKQLASRKKMEPFLLAALGMPGHPSGSRQALSRATLEQDARSLELEADRESVSSQEAARLKAVAAKMLEAAKGMREFHPVPDVMERIRSSLKGTKKLGERDPDVVTSQVYSALSGTSAFSSPTSQVTQSARRELSPVENVMGQAGRRASEVMEALRASNIIESGVEPDPGDVTRLFRDISNNNPALLHQLVSVHGERKGLEMERELRNAVDEMVGLTQKAAMMRSEEQGDPSMEIYLGLMEQADADGKVPDAVIHRLNEKHGEEKVAAFVVDGHIGEWAHREAKLWWDENMPAGRSVAEQAMIGTYDPMEALTSYLGTSELEGTDYLVYKEQRLRDIFQRAGEKPNFLTRKVFQALTWVNEMIGRPQSSSTVMKRGQLTNSRIRHALTEGDALTRETIGNLQKIMLQMSSELGGLNRFDREMVLKIHEFGGFVRIKNEADFEKAFPGLGHLYGIGQRQNELMNQIGQELVNVGYLTREQFEANKDRYSLWLKKNKDLTNEEVARQYLQAGVEGLNLSGRDISREASGQADWEERIWDPLLILPVQVGQEASTIGTFRMLNSVIDGTYGEIGISRSEYEGMNEFERMGWRKAADVGDKATPAQRRLYGFLQAMKDGMAYDAYIRREEDLAKLADGLRSGAFKKLPDGTYTGKGVGRVLKDIAANTKKIESSTRPTTGRKVQLIRKYLDEGIYVTRNVSDEMHFALEELLNRPDPSSFTNGFWMGLEQTARAWRRAKTVMNPKHHTLNMISSVMTNHATGGVSMFSFARALAGEKNEYNTAGARLQEWNDWLETHDGDISSAPGHIREVHEVAQILGNSTLWSSMLEADAMWDMIGSVVSGTNFESTGNSVADFFRAQTELATLMASSQAAFDMKIMRWFGATDPQKAAQAIQVFAGQYQLNELFFKLANYYHFKARNPGMSIRQAALAGARGTADYADSSPLLRRWGSRFTPMVSKLFRETETKLRVKGLDLPIPVDRTARLLFGSPFQLYRAYMLPTLAHAAVNNKLRRLSLMGVLGITAMAVGGDDDEAMDAMAGGPGREGMPLSDQAQRMIAEFMEPIDQGLRGIGDGMGFAVDHDGKARSQAGAWFKGLLNAAKKLPRRALQLEPYTFQTISSPGETRMSSGEDFDTLTDMVLDVARGIRAGANGSMEDAARGLLSGIYGLVPNAMAGSALSAARVFRGQSGKPRGEVAFEELRTIMSQAFPVGSPMWTFSPTMMKGHEALNGRSFLDSIRGIERIVEDPNRRALGSFVFGELWRSEKASSASRAMNFDKPMIDVVFNLEDSRIGAPPSSDEMTESRRIARKRVLNQVTTLITDTYANHRSGAYGKQSFDKSLHAQLGLEQDLHKKPSGELGINRKPQTTLGRFLAQQDPDVRAVAIEDTQRLLTRMASGPALYHALDIGRRGRVEPPVFRRMFLSSLRDPGGEGLVRLMADEMKLRRTDKGVVAKGDTSNSAAYYKLFVELAPSINSMSDVGREKYRRLFDYFVTKSGGDPAFPDADVRAILGPKAFDLAPAAAERR